MSRAKSIGRRTGDLRNIIAVLAADIVGASALVQIKSWCHPKIIVCTNRKPQESEMVIILSVVAFVTICTIAGILLHVVMAITNALYDIFGW